MVHLNNKREEGNECGLRGRVIYGKNARCIRMRCVIVRLDPVGSKYFYFTPLLYPTQASGESRW